MLDSNFAWLLLQHPIELKDPVSNWMSDKEVAQLHGLFLFLSCGSEFVTEPQFETGIRMLGLSTEISSKKIEKTEMKVESTSINFDSFLVRVKEILLKKKDIEGDLRTLFSFHSHKGESISRKELRHLLVDVETPYRLSATSYFQFEKSLLLNVAQEDIPIKNLIRRILFSLG